MILFTLNARLINFSNPGPWLGAETFLFWSVGCLFWKTWWEMWGFVNSRTSREDRHFYSLSSFYNPMRFCSLLDRISPYHIFTLITCTHGHVFTGDQRDNKTCLSCGFLCEIYLPMMHFIRSFSMKQVFNLCVVSICSLLFTRPNLLKAILDIFIQWSTHSKINSFVCYWPRSNPCSPQGENYISTYNSRWLSNTVNNSRKPL